MCLQKKSKTNGSDSFGYASIMPPPQAPVKVYSEVIAVNTAQTVASNALPPSLRIYIAALTVVLSPAAMLPYFI